MSRTLLLALAPVALLAASPVARAQAPAIPTAAAPAAPDLGQVAPDFTAQWADGAGQRATPVRLSTLRGKVVVLAFYPKDRTTGCTAEMTKFRDENASLFGGGADVVVLPISADSIPSHVSWASDMKFPFALVSDPSFTVSDAYGSHAPGRPVTARTVFVIGKDGRIAWREMRFNALSEDAYTALKDAVAKAR